MTTPNGTPFELPQDLIAVLVQAAADEAGADTPTGGWWGVARNVCDLIDELPRHRAAIIKRAALHRQVKVETMREAVHTAEVFPPGVEHDPQYALLGWSHYTVMSRAGDNAVKGINKLVDVATELYNGQTPPVEAARELVRELNGTKRRPRPLTALATVVGFDMRDGTLTLHVDTEVLEQVRRARAVDVVLKFPDVLVES